MIKMANIMKSGVQGELPIGLSKEFGPEINTYWQNKQQHCGNRRMARIISLTPFSVRFLRDL